MRRLNPVDWPRGESIQRAAFRVNGGGEPALQWHCGNMRGSGGGGSLRRASTVYLDEDARGAHDVFSPDKRVFTVQQRRIVRICGALCEAHWTQTNALLSLPSPPTHAIFSSPPHTPQRSTENTHWRSVWLRNSPAIQPAMKSSTRKLLEVCIFHSELLCAPHASNLTVCALSTGQNTYCCWLLPLITYRPKLFSQEGKKTAYRR